ncbi:hypothetical protein HHI36_003306 [Cryptolaemus montrouzieri]|uniref:FKRP stem domain-containing protein n=1 Tax=Cryptolaemus montrouzieri TaxID=559131 RepID=A0ABD2PD03_9CUCU
MILKCSKLIAFIVIFINIGLVYYSLRLFSYHHKIDSHTSIVQHHSSKIKSLNSYEATDKYISKLVTVIIREFETHENDVSATIDSILKISPNIKIFILYDKIPYPPLNIRKIMLLVLI